MVKALKNLFDILKIKNYVFKVAPKNQIEDIVISYKGGIYSESELQERLFDLFAPITTPTPTKLSLKIGEKLELIEVDDILIIEKVDKKTYFYFDNGEGYSSKPLELYSKALKAKDFIRVNKSQVINFKRIKSVTPLFNSKVLVFLDDDTCIEVNRAYKKEFDEKFKEDIL